MNNNARFDHAVVNTRYAMDEAQPRFEQIGFSLTDRGYHSLGSINHLMMFDTDYLELIGLPAGADAPTRRGVSDAPCGINGLVFKTNDADATFAHLQSIGMDGDPPNSFSRPVVMPDGTHDACFRTVHVRPDVFPAGRVYFCEHQTPELVWQPQWQNQGNSAHSIADMVMVCNDASQQADAMARLLQADVQARGEGFVVPLTGGQISVLTPESYRARYGSLASEPGKRRAIFGALVLRCTDLNRVRGLTLAPDQLLNDNAGNTDSVVIRDSIFDTVIEFVPQ